VARGQRGAGAGVPDELPAIAHGFTAASIDRGRVLYAAQCVACHGSDGKGQGPLAAAQPVWPPNLAGPLLWRRADGDVLWHVLNGTRDRRGATTMPGFGPALRDEDAWALIDFMKAQGAGESLRAAGLWTQPIAPPDVAVQCKASRRACSAAGAGSACASWPPAASSPCSKTRAWSRCS
jgi:mono/diheme cytochrome c family protein